MSKLSHLLTGLKLQSYLVTIEVGCQTSLVPIAKDKSSMQMKSARKNSIEVNFTLVCDDSQDADFCENCLVEKYGEPLAGRYR
jgi:hypothetical protein